MLLENLGTMQILIGQLQNMHYLEPHGIILSAMRSLHSGLKQQVSKQHSLIRKTY